MDAQLRELERVFKDSGLTEDLLAFVRARARVRGTRPPEPISMIRWVVGRDEDVGRRSFRILSDYEEHVLCGRHRFFFWVVDTKSEEIALVHAPFPMMNDIHAIVNDPEYGERVFKLEDGVDLRIRVEWERSRGRFPRWTIFPNREISSLPQHLRPKDDLLETYGPEILLAARHIDAVWTKAANKQEKNDD